MFFSHGVHLLWTLLLHICTVKILNSNRGFLWLCKLIFNFDVAMLVENDVIGC